MVLKPSFLTHTQEQQPLSTNQPYPYLSSILLNMATLRAGIQDGFMHQFCVRISDMSGGSLSLESLMDDSDLKLIFSKAFEEKTNKPKKVEKANKPKKTKSAPKKEPVAKVSLEDRQSADIDHGKCLCRVWKNGLDNIQCSSKKVEGDFCRSHAKKIDQFGPWWLGIVTEKRPEEPYGPPSVKKPGRHYWTDQPQPEGKGKKKSEPKKDSKSKKEEEPTKVSKPKSDKKKSPAKENSKKKSPAAEKVVKTPVENEVVKTPVENEVVEKVEEPVIDKPVIKTEEKENIPTPVVDDEDTDDESNDAESTELSTDHNEYEQDLSNLDTDISDEDSDEDDN